MKKEIFYGGCLLTAFGLSSFGSGSAITQFEKPFRVEASGKPIDVEIGHAAPLVTDFDGDGTQDLLVGQFGGGKLRIYKNFGTAQKPKFDQFAWFQAGGKDGMVPAG